MTAQKKLMSWFELLEFCERKMKQHDGNDELQRPYDDMYDTIYYAMTEEEREKYIIWRCNK